jgi:hypothetical protein
MDDPDVFRRCRNCRLTAGECDCHRFTGDEEANEAADREREMRQEVDAINGRQQYRD